MATATAMATARSLAALVLVALCITGAEAFGPRPRPRLYSKVRLERVTRSIASPTDRARKRETRCRTLASHPSPVISGV